MALEVAVERYGGDAVDECSVAVFLVEWGLVIESRGEAEGPVGRVFGEESERCPWRNECFAVEGPVGKTQTIGKVEESGRGMAPPGVLCEEFHAVGGEAVLAAQAVDEFQLVGNVRQ